MLFSLDINKITADAVKHIPVDRQTRTPESSDTLHNIIFAFLNIVNFAKYEPTFLTTLTLPAFKTTRPNSLPLSTNTPPTSARKKPKAHNDEKIISKFQNSLSSETETQALLSVKSDPSLNDCQENCNIAYKNINKHNVTLESIFYFGEHLSIAKKICNKEKVNFTKWKENLLEKRPSTLNSYLQFYKNFKFQKREVLKSKLPFSFFRKHGEIISNYLSLSTV